MGDPALFFTHLHLEGKAPYFSMPRHKVLAKVKQEKSVTRVIPLAPETVTALRELRRINPGEYVFYCQWGLPWGKMIIFSRMKSLKAKAGLAESPFTFKHLRNIGPNVADELDLPLQRIDGFLGHSIKSMASHYMRAEKSASQYQALVDEIAKRYFQPPTKKG